VAYEQPYDIQIVVDAAEPHRLADWWAQTLGWVVEPSDEEFIRRMIAEGHATDEQTMVHNGSLVWRDGAAIRHPDAPAGLNRPRVLFQLVPEGNKTVPKIKNKLHMDLRVGEDDVDAVVAKLTERGATFLWNGEQGPHTWVTMADPEGNEFCVSR
jgi:glyoxalase superfamily protein